MTTPTTTTSIHAAPTEIADHDHEYDADQEHDLDPDHDQAQAEPESDPDPDADLLADYWNPDLTILQIAERNNISLPELDAWCARPDVVRALDTLARMDAQRSRRLIALAQSSAAGALVRATASPNIETARRAAATLTRLHHQHTARPRATTLGVPAERRAEPQPFTDEWHAPVPESMATPSAEPQQVTDDAAPPTPPSPPSHLSTPNTITPPAPPGGRERDAPARPGQGHMHRGPLCSSA